MKRASEVVQPGDVIRFVALAPLQGTGRSSEEEFLRAWQEAVERGPLLPGLAYRDLCRQIPAWNQQISAEIQHPNPFSFIDYAILRAGTDPATVPVPRAAAITGFECTAGLYRVAAHFQRREAESEPEMVLYNLFEVHGPPAVEERFAAGWPPRAEYQSHQPGFFSAMLHRRLGPEARFAALNRSEWLSAEDYAQTLPGFERAFPREQRAAAGGPGAAGLGGPPVRSHLGLFRRVAVAPAE